MPAYFRVAGRPPLLAPCASHAPPALPPSDGVPRGHAARAAASLPPPRARRV
ncbi:uncharacterized protein K452DRAFT_286988 [Aplosporella prunicola CBS 121167]|uniref:Uncharacterized protein n=1 Tax=Aplosporella prunicola CBS 121167 TaxID=1176127 RepID=A0A6A6BJ32_9PEZI|nr:uncharacterized protein K452DRAFT_286988 [Aplosporella prunicola CBS 121167]KAF2142561.1 hypothetical protein K452DRAFT_286988 [Aplosporella prunicola CBS 121167]